MIDLYIMEIPKKPTIEEVFPYERNSEIQAVNNPTLKAEKYCVWRLLEYGALKSLGLDFHSLSFKKTDTGRWICDKFCFSISHNGGAACVLISDSAPCGVDIQKIGKEHNDAFAKRILTDKEYARYTKLSHGEREEYLMLCWSAKEAVYKIQGIPPFSPAKIDTSTGVYKKIINLPYGSFAIAAACDGAVCEPKLYYT